MTVAWYVHHQGAGHLARLGATAPHLDEPPVVLSSLPRPAGSTLDWVDLPLDLARAPEDADARGTLHWAPLRHAGLRARMALVADALARVRADVLVADVSVEVALLARLLGIPTVLVAQRGTRTDAPHALAYAQAAAVACPWTPVGDRPGALPPTPNRVFTGAISRFDGGPAFPPLPSGGDVLFVTGVGGHDITPAAVRAAALSTPERTWHVAGALRVDGPNVVDHGSGADVEALLRRCSVVVGSAGGNVVAEVAAARRPFVCLPQPRPFDEQADAGRALERLGVAEVRPAFPPAAEWPTLLAAAEARDTAGWSALHDGKGARRLAALVQAAASRSDRTPSARAVAAVAA